MRRSKHALSSTHLTSLDMGELIPISLIETLPGDSIQMSSSALIRLAPMLSPPMHPVVVRIHHWFVPHRLVWDGWEDFITGGPDGNDTSAFPTVAPQAVAAGSLSNYLGLPIGNIPAVSALPYRAYGLIWNEWYRDQDLQSEVTVSTASGNDTTTNKTLLRAAWPKDYFTTARPWEQKGPAVSIPGADGVVKGIGIQAASTATAGYNVYFSDGTTASNVPGWSGNPIIVPSKNTGAPGAANSPEIRVEGAGSITVNQLRESLAIQRFEEARAMYGSRYTEYLMASFKVRSSDARLQRPEYLGGGKQNIQFSEIIQSAQDGGSGSETPVGTLRGHGITAMKSNRFRRFFEEHGYIVTCMSILPKSIYMNGIQRTWNRRTKYDFYQPELENLGQQPILNKEIYAPAANPDGTFGYTDRYDEYRKQWSRVTGEFATSMLDYWHFGRSFASEPALNSTFVTAVPTERPFASTITDTIYAQIHNSVKARRMVSARANPKTF